MSAPKFIADSFAVRTAAHLAHLTTRSYAEHVALGEFYVGLTDLVDKYAEVYMGLAAKIPSFPSVAPSQDPPKVLLSDYALLIRAEQRAGDESSQALLNILAEIEELTAQALYKVRFLK